jgi:hypothetical protein
MAMSHCSGTRLLRPLGAPAASWPHGSTSKEKISKCGAAFENQEEEIAGCNQEEAQLVGGEGM